MKLKDLEKIKVKDLSGWISNGTLVKLIINGLDVVYEGMYVDIPDKYRTYYINKLIPIVYPENQQIGMLAIHIWRK